MKYLDTKLVLNLGPKERNPRNSEGSFIRADDGSIWHTYSQYCGDLWHDHQPCNIAFIRSADEGETWSEPKIIVRAEQLGTTNVMSTSMIRQNDGRIGIYFGCKFFDGKEGKTDGVWSNIARAVTSDGENFEMELCKMDAPKGYYVKNNDRLVRISDGRLVYPVAHYVNGRCSSTLFISEDDGKTFKIHDTLLHAGEELMSKKGFEEPGIIEHEDGSFRIWMRSDVGYQYESFSYDNLKTLTKPVPSAFTSPRSPMEIERGPGGELYTIYNPVPTYNGRYTPYATHGGRNPLVIRKSTDDGKTWGELYVIEADEERGLCYPAMFFTNDNCLLVSYCRGGGDDGFCLTRHGIRKFSLDQIK